MLRYPYQRSMSTKRGMVEECGSTETAKIGGFPTGKSLVLRSCDVRRSESLVTVALLSVTCDILLRTLLLTPYCKSIMSTAQVTYNHRFITTKNSSHFSGPDHFLCSSRRTPALSLRVQSCNVRKRARKRNMLGKRSGMNPTYAIAMRASTFGFIPLGTGTTRITPCTERGEDRLGAGEAPLECLT